MSNFNPSTLLTAHLHPTREELESAAQEVLRWALHHHSTLPDQPIGATASPDQLRAEFGEPPPASGRPFADLLRTFDERIAPFAMRTDHPRFFAFIPGAAAFPSVLGDWLCSASNFFAGSWLEGSGPAQIELTVLDWFKSWLGYPLEAQGLLTSGGSEANLTALVVARERIAFADRGRSVLYTSDQRHGSIDRAAQVIGLHPDQICHIPVENDLKLHVHALMNAVRRDRAAGRLPWLVVANAGATNTGTVDPLGDLADCCRSERLWLHVDAAYGWATVLTEEGQRVLAGIERADSITLDPHKWFAQTYEAGCLLMRDGKRLAETFTSRPPYLQDVEPNEGEINFADRGLALTRRFRALKIWLSVQMLGLDWFRELIERGLYLAGYAQTLLESTGCFEILHARHLSIVCFRYRNLRPETDLDAINATIARELAATQRAFLSTTRLRGRVALRMCFTNWRTTTADVEEVVNLLEEIGKKCG